LAGVRYETGLGTHATSKLTYRLDGKYALFTTDLGLDDSTIGGVGTAVFEVWVETGRSINRAVMRGGDKPGKLRIDVTARPRYAWS